LPAKIFLRLRAHSRKIIKLFPFCLLPVILAPLSTSFSILSSTIICTFSTSHTATDDIYRKSRKGKLFIFTRSLSKSFAVLFNFTSRTAENFPFIPPIEGWKVKRTLENETFYVKNLQSLQEKRSFEMDFDKEQLKWNDNDSKLVDQRRLLEDSLIFRFFSSLFTHGLQKATFLPSFLATFA
jgi:hypothetical protein